MDNRAGPGVTLQGNRLAMRLHDFGQDLAAGAYAFLGQRGQWLIHHVEERSEVGFLRINVEDAGEDLSFCVGLHQHLDGMYFVGGIVVFMQFA